MYWFDFNMFPMIGFSTLSWLSKTVHPPATAAASHVTFQNIFNHTSQSVCPPLWLLAFVLKCFKSQPSKELKMVTDTLLQCFVSQNIYQSFHLRLRLQSKCWTHCGPSSESATPALAGLRLAALISRCVWNTYSDAEQGSPDGGPSVQSSVDDQDETHSRCCHAARGQTHTHTHY